MARIAAHAIFVILHKASLKPFASRTPPLAPLADRVSVWLVSVGMVLVFLILVLFMIQVESSQPKNTHPTESAWYCHALPLFNILGQDRPGPVLSPTCHTTLQQVIAISTNTWQRSLDQAIERTKWKKPGRGLLSETDLASAHGFR